MISCSLVKENGTVNCSFELSNVNSFLEVNKIKLISNLFQEVIFWCKTFLTCISLHSSR